MVMGAIFILFINLCLSMKSVETIPFLNYKLIKCLGAFHERLYFFCEAVFERDLHGLEQIRVVFSKS